MTTGWDRRFVDSTRGRIVSLLRRGRRTVEELAQAVGLTDNAVRSHIAALERDGLVRQVGVRRGVGKPAYDYELTRDADRLFPKPYASVLRETLEVLSERIGHEEAEELMRTVGRRLAAAHPRPHGTLRERLEFAVSLLDGLGGLAETEERDGSMIIRGHSCPLAAVAATRPEACELAEALLTEVVGVPVCEHCTRGEPPRCCFEVALADDASALSGRS
ncbi:MAG: helix-turn-helix domain-containing protein [Chloroflexota bacterium]|nr:helix-turn-helix domain-containing protein [Chloroflexota bacterium]